MNLKSNMGKSEFQSFLIMAIREALRSSNFYAAKSLIEILDASVNAESIVIEVTSP